MGLPLHRRRRAAIALAVAVSAAVHLLVLAVILRDWSAPLPVYREDVVEVMLDRPDRPPPPEEPPKPQVKPPEDLQPRAPVRVVESPIAPFAVAPAPPLAATGQRPSAPPAAERSLTPLVIRVPCQDDLSKMTQRQRDDCMRWRSETSRQAAARAVGRGDALSKSVTDIPNMRPELRDEFSAAYQERRKNDPAPIPARNKNCVNENATGCASENAYSPMLSSKGTGTIQNQLKRITPKAKADESVPPLTRPSDSARAPSVFRPADTSGAPAPMR